MPPERLQFLTAELERLRSEQARIAEEYRDPSLTGWYYNEGALMGISDLLAEECLILQEIAKANNP